MIRKTASIPIAALLLSFLVVGCRTLPQSAASPTGIPLEIDDVRAERVLASYLEQVDARSGLRGSARVKLTGPDFKLNRPQRIVVERPARLRFEVIGLFDQLAAVLVTDGGRFGYYDASNGEISRGRVTSTLLWDLAQIDLDAEEAVGLLLGAPAPSLGVARAGVWLEANDRIALGFAWPRDRNRKGCELEPERALLDAACFLATRALDAGGEIFVFDGDGRLAELRALGADGVVRFRAFFEDYAERAGADSAVEFANRVTIRSPGVGAEARFVWKRVMLGGPLSDRLFTLPVRGASGREG
ncbi:MAG: hypothetical protein CL908_21595 [Deltaproteobacteria bacterium]|nr:hypothetical protein [Deltaproteobacteria bacterium]